jgi:hypothetical protein
MPSWGSSCSLRRQPHTWSPWAACTRRVEAVEEARDTSDGERRSEAPPAPGLPASGAFPRFDLNPLPGVPPPALPPGRGAPGSGDRACGERAPGGGGDGGGAGRAPGGDADGEDDMDAVRGAWQASRRRTTTASCRKASTRSRAPPEERVAAAMHAVGDRGDSTTRAHLAASLIEDSASLLAGACFDPCDVQSGQQGRVSAGPIFRT